MGGTPSHFAQSVDSASSACLRNPACYAQLGDDAIIPWLSRAASAIRGAVTVERLLEAAEVARVEEILVECAKEADRQIDEQEYGPGRFPSDAECDRVVRYVKDQEVTRAMELGVLKHEAAFACVQRELLTLFPENISVEPRYGPAPPPAKYALTEQWLDSLKPDIVLHFSGNPNRVQCVYDFKFPCKASRKSNPLSIPGVEQQLRSYDDLGGNCPSAIVTPQLGVNHAWYQP